MANPYIWAGLQRANNDPTTIDEAIGEAITAHNDDPDAHLGPTQALESHRASEIIDHRAESVVNDKIATIARAYVAIVDPASSTDFDTIQSAVTYAAGKGGGTILITPGDHYLDGHVEVPMSINFAGVDQDSCKIHGNYTTGDYIEYVADPVNTQMNATLTNLAIVSGGGAPIHCNYGWGVGTTRLTFENVSFLGGNEYINVGNQYTYMNNCYVECNATAAFAVGYWLITDGLECVSLSGVTSARLLTYSSYGLGVAALRLNGVRYNGPGGWYSDSLFFGNIDTITVQNCYMYGFGVWDYFGGGYNFINNEIGFNASGYFNVYTNGAAFTANKFYGGTGNVVRFGTGSGQNTFIGNSVPTAITDQGTGNIIYGNNPEVMFTTLASSATACGLALNNTAQLTPNSTRTLTTTVPIAGQRRSLIILTSGTTSYTLTFGTGFKTTGTLATGTTSARRFIIEFISDGTSLIETSRTVAIA